MFGLSDSDIGRRIRVNTSHGFREGIVDSIRVTKNRDIVVVFKDDSGAFKSARIGTQDDKGNRWDVPVRFI